MTIFLPEGDDDVDSLSCHPENTLIGRWMERCRWIYYGSYRDRPLKLKGTKNVGNDRIQKSTVGDNHKHPKH